MYKHILYTRSRPIILYWQQHQRGQISVDFNEKLNITSQVKSSMVLRQWKIGNGQSRYTVSEQNSFTACLLYFIISLLKYTLVPQL